MLQASAHWMFCLPANAAGSEMNARLCALRKSKLDRRLRRCTAGEIALPLTHVGAANECN